MKYNHHFKSNFKLNFKQIFAAVLLLSAVAAFVFFPFSCAKLHIKLYFAEDSAATDCLLYYATETSPDLSSDKIIHAVLKDNMADFVLPAELCGKLTMLRLDFSEADSLIVINRIELCSGGFIQKSFDATDFFAEGNVAATNDLYALQCTLTNAYIGTSGIDPYIILYSNLTAECNQAYSHYTVTKLLCCIYLAAVVFLSRKQIFHACPR